MTDPDPARYAAEHDRDAPPGAAEARRRFGRFREPQADPAAGWVPVWSSAALDEALAQVFADPDATTSGVMRGLWDLLEETVAPLTPPMANFLRDVVVASFTGYRSRYRAGEFAWLPAQLVRASPAQAYLASLAAPEPLGVDGRTHILDRLAGTDFYQEAVDMLDD